MCSAVTDREIRHCVRAGAQTVDEVGERSFAGTGCGGCQESIEAILAEEGNLIPAGERALSHSA